MNRKRLLLTVLLLVLAAALGYAYLAMPRLEQAPAGDRTTVSAGTDAAAGSAPERTKLRLELLEEKQEPFPGYRKNIFDSILPPPPPPAPAPKPAAPPPPPETLPVPKQTTTATVQRELARFTFLGYLEKDGEKSVFLSRDEELFVVGRGSRFGSENEFRVAELTPEKLTITQAGDERRIVVELVDQSPLIPHFRRASPRGDAGGESTSVPGQRPMRVPPPTAPGPRPATDDQPSPDMPPGMPEASNEVMK